MVNSHDRTSSFIVGRIEKFATVQKRVFVIRTESNSFNISLVICVLVSNIYRVRSCAFSVGYFYDRSSMWLLQLK